MFEVVDGVLVINELCEDFLGSDMVFEVQSGLHKGRGTGLFELLNVVLHLRLEETSVIVHKTFRAGKAYHTKPRAAHVKSFEGQFGRGHFSILPYLPTTIAIVISMPGSS